MEEKINCHQSADKTENDEDFIWEYILDFCNTQEPHAVDMT